MKEIGTIGLDITKKVFEVHGIDDAGEVVVPMPPRYVKPYVKRNGVETLFEVIAKGDEAAS